MPEYGFATRATHACQAPEPAAGAVIAPIKGYDDARSGNPRPARAPWPPSRAALTHASVAGSPLEVPADLLEDLEQALE